MEPTMERKLNILMILVVVAIITIVTSCDSSFFKLDERIVSSNPSKVFSNIETASVVHTDGSVATRVEIKLRSAWNTAISAASVTIWISGSPNPILCSVTNLSGIAKCELPLGAADDKLITVATHQHPGFTLTRLNLSESQKKGIDASILRTTENSPF